MEYLALSANGQWSLHKNTNDHDADSVAPHTADTRPYEVFQGHSMTGQLAVDHGSQGTLHDFGGGSRPKAEHTKQARIGQPNHPVDSMYSDRHPGDGE
jgi:hypothetical protein